MKGAADTSAARDRERERALRDLAERLRQRLPRIPSAYRAGRSALIKALVGLEELTPTRASRLVTELSEAGLVKYTTEGRGIGAAGVWTYALASPAPATRAKPPGRTRRSA